MCNWHIKELFSHSMVTFIGPVFSFIKACCCNGICRVALDDVQRFYSFSSELYVDKLASGLGIIAFGT